MAHLVRFKEFSVEELAPRLHDTARQSRRSLVERYHLGALARYGQDLQIATAATERAIRNDASANETTGVQAFAVIAEQMQPELFKAEPIVGVGTIFHGLQLARLRASVKPRTADKVPLLKKPIQTVGPNVTAWTVMDQETTTLAETYQELVSRTTEQGCWTVEPTGNPDRLLPNPVISMILTHAGLHMVDGFGRPKRYDIGESRKIVPPLSDLYVHDASEE